MKGKHQLSITDAHGNLWLNVPVQNVQMTDDGLLAEFATANQATAAPPPVAKETRRGWSKTRKKTVRLTPVDAIKVLEEIRAFVPSGSSNINYDRMYKVERKWNISHSVAMSIHNATHTHIRKKKAA